MIFSVIAVALVVTQDLTGEYQIQSEEARTHTMMLPMKNPHSEIQMWGRFTSGNWYLLEADCKKYPHIKQECHQHKERENND
jgi:hypothetical protein